MSWTILIILIISLLLICTILMNYKKENFVVPVDCAVSSWSVWSPCTKSCGSGTKKRNRTITKQPANGGRSCPSLSETTSCNTQRC